MSRAEERLLNPPSGGRIEAARAHGVDLTLLVEHLRKIPEDDVFDSRVKRVGLSDIQHILDEAEKVRRGLAA